MSSPDARRPGWDLTGERRDPEWLHVRQVELLAWAVALLEAVSLSVITPMLPAIARENGLSSAALGMVTGAYLFGGLVAMLPAAAIARHVGSRAATSGGLLLLSVGGVGVGVTAGADLLIVARGVQGAGSALAWAGVMAALIEAVPAGRRGRAIGNTLAAAFVGAALGPIAGAGALAWSRLLVLGLIVLGCCACMVLALLLVRPRAAVQALVTSRRDRFPGGRMPTRGRWASALVLVAGLAAGGRMVLAPVALSEGGADGATIGLIFSLAGLVMAASAILAGRWSDRSGSSRVVLVGGAGIAFTSCLMAVVGGVLPLATVVVVAGATVQMVMTAGVALITSAGLVQGLDAAALWTRSNLLWTVGILIGNVGAGWSASLVGQPWTWMGLAVSATLVVALAATHLHTRGPTAGPGTPGRPPA